MSRTLVSLIIVIAFHFLTPAQQSLETKKALLDAHAVLNNSAWGKTQTETDTSEMFFSPTTRGRSSLEATQASSGGARDQQVRNNNRTDRGALNQAISINYYIRLFSSRPIREALTRIALIRIQNPTPSDLEEWRQFVDRDFGPFIVVTVTYGSPDGRFLGPAIQAFSTATKNSLRNSTYLERDDGKRVFLSDYRPPGEDGLGAKFVFPRKLNGEAFVSSINDSVRFVTDAAKDIKLNVRFKLSEMVYNDRLEY